jgi:hypothetical protein
MFVIFSPDSQKKQIQQWILLEWDVTDLFSIWKSKTTQGAPVRSVSDSPRVPDVKAW